MFGDTLPELLDETLLSTPEFLDLVDKWTKMVDGADNDPAKIAKATQDEIWSKVDFKTYGM